VQITNRKLKMPEVMKARCGTRKRALIAVPDLIAALGPAQGTDCPLSARLVPSAGRAARLVSWTGIQGDIEIGGKAAIAGPPGH
jgi:hypothetical protein